MLIPLIYTVNQICSNAIQEYNVGITPSWSNVGMLCVAVAVACCGSINTRSVHVDGAVYLLGSV